MKAKLAECHLSTESSLGGGWGVRWGGERVSFQNERQELGKCPYFLSTPSGSPSASYCGGAVGGGRRGKLRSELVRTTGRGGGQDVKILGLAPDPSVLLQVILNVNERGQVLPGAGN